MNRRRRRRRVSPKFFVILALLAAIAVLCILLLKDGWLGASPEPTPLPGVAGTPGLDQTPIPTPTPTPAFEPASISDATSPSAFGLETAVTVDGAETASYSRGDRIDFFTGQEYTALEGIITFRGDNFRSFGSYGAASITEQKFDTNYWTVATGGMPKKTGSGSWSGSGWTGQPLIVRWPEATKQAMNLYDSAKAKQGLVEVIYATMDGNIYFLDLSTGEKTRDPINVGYPFKGAGALDPRGVPLLFVGSGDDTSLHGGKTARAFIISLVTGEVLYTFGDDDPFSLRRGISFFDSSPLVDAATDTLIWPGESGILYMMKLNTHYNEAAGTLSIDPAQVVRWRYKGARSGRNNQYWLGVEDSLIVWRGHAIFTDNGGHMFCLDLNTLEVKWMQDTLDDTNCTPVLALEGEDRHPYVYTSTSFHGGWRAPMDSKATVPIWKIDAVTGEIVWHVDYECQTEDSVSGGVQGSPMLGQQGLEGLLFVPVSRTPSHSAGVLAAIDTELGQVVWEFPMDRYPWSSPVCVYDESGKGYIVQGNQAGDMFLIDGLTGTQLDVINLGGNIEATPAVFEGRLVVGTRRSLICGVKLR